MNAALLPLHQDLAVAKAQRESSVAGIARAEAESPLGSLQKGLQLVVEEKVDVGTE